MGKILRVNMTSLSINVEENFSIYGGLGGRGLTSTIIANEVPPTCNPLGYHNKLSIAPGLLAGTNVPNSGRLSVGFKSPLTEGIKESNVGGTAAHFLGNLGISAIVIEGLPEKENQYLLYLSKKESKLLPASSYYGMKNYSLIEALRKEYGDKTSILSIGPAGEMKLATATIAYTDINGFPCRHAGRGGAGAVMGSKGLKAIIIDNHGCSRFKEISFEEKFKEGISKLTNSITKHPFTGYALKIIGTNVLASALNAVGSYQSMNFRKGTFHYIENVCGEYINEIIKKRGGKTSFGGCSTCNIQCSNVYLDEKGNHVTSGLDYETVWANGANLGIFDFDLIARLDRFCNEFGLDSDELGLSLGIAIEAGLIKFGDDQGILRLLGEIEKGTPLGRILANGSKIMGKVFGILRVPIVKNQGIAGYDPRALQGMGITYSTSPMGADSFAGWVVKSNLLSFGGNVSNYECAELINNSFNIQIFTAAMDCTGLCCFANFPILDDPEGKDGFLVIMNAYYGRDVRLEDIFALGKRVIKTERDFNILVGFTKADDRLPDFFKEESLPFNNNFAFTIPDDEIDRFWAKID